MDDRARAAHIAELAARLAAIESRDQASTSSPMRGSSSAADEPVADRTAKHGSADGASSAVSKRSTGSTGSNRSSGPIGSSGTTGRRREPGGHPEDAPGDPAAVARSICLRLLTGAARPRAALETALRQRGIPDDVAAGVLDRLTEVGLIDDRAYAEAFVAAKHRDRALGSSALRTELRRKGVDDVTVDAAVRTVDSDAELARAKALIERRVDSAMGNGPVAARRRLVGLLARRGYSAEVSARVVDEALAAYGAEQDDGRS
jgi:regulatory protein